MFIFRIVAAFIIFLAPVGALAAEPNSPGVVISEVQTGSGDSGSHEFVELYNPTASPISVDGWMVEYKSASSTGSWTKKATLAGTIPALGFYLIAPVAYLPASDAEWTSGLASSGGNIRLKSSDDTVIDQLGYGTTANAAEASPATAPAVGEGLERLPGFKNEEGGNAIDTGDNLADFVVRPVSNPQSTASAIEVPDEILEVPAEEMEAEVPAADPVIYPKVLITELLIDPQSPLTDAEDEFIELFNPGSESVTITGYTFRAGTNFNDEYVLPETTIEPGEYRAFYSINTHLSLVNAGGAVQIIDPTGAVVDQTEVYPQVEPGLAWALTDGSWDWTLQTTPAAANVFVAPLVAESAAKASTKKPAAKKTAAPKKATAKKAAAAKKPKDTKVKAAATSKAAAPQPKNFQPANGLIALLIGLTITYAIYEFRYDIQNLYRRARSHN